MTPFFFKVEGRGAVDLEPDTSTFYTGMPTIWISLKGPVPIVQR